MQLLKVDSGGAFSDPLFRRCSVVGSQLSCLRTVKGRKGSKSTRIFHDMGKLIVRQICRPILTILDEDIYNQDGTLGCFKILGEVL
jgi:hypothetical protein